MKPRMPVRRFDVFAEYNRLKALQEGMDEAHARGHGLWVAKVVASGGRRATGRPPGPERDKEQDGSEQPKQGGAPEPEEWRTLAGEPQTDELFEREIVRRMGADFYDQIFAPAIAEAFREGRRYESIRDTIRKDWKPGS